MTANRPDLDALEKLADSATTVRRDANGLLDGDDAYRIYHAYFEATPPATIKALIAELKEARGLLKPFAVYYEINDLDERLADDTIEVPVGDLRLARAFLARNGEGEE